MTSPQFRPTRITPRRVEELAKEFNLAVATPSISSDSVVTGIAVGTDDVQVGDLFVALTGLKRHGAQYAQLALERGAVAILTDDEGVERALETGLPVLLGTQLRERLGVISSWIYGDPAETLRLVGVTGSNGKTTTSYFIDAALRTKFQVTALSGTVELVVGERSIPSPRTTVEAPVLHGLFAFLRESEVAACTLEVSSHALALHRVGGCHFDVAVFTNLQRDHLDFHNDMEGYFAAKSQMFAPNQARHAVICVDDEWGLRLSREVEIPLDTVAANPASVGYETADWKVSDEQIGRHGVVQGAHGIASTFTLTGPNASVRAVSPLAGGFNVINAAVAIVAAHRMGTSLESAAEAIAEFRGVPGRMEQIGARGPGPFAVVDYAHTPDALVLALEALRPVTPGRLIHVFGSDGDRDRGKRPIMGEISARLADVIIVTDENPRSEPPADIRAAILSGARGGPAQEVLEATSRVDAIAMAVGLAEESDTIVITGKGHEPYQEIAGVFHPQLDSDVLRKALNGRWG